MKAHSQVFRAFGICPVLNSPRFLTSIINILLLFKSFCNWDLFTVVYPLPLKSLDKNPIKPHPPYFYLLSKTSFNALYEKYKNGEDIYLQCFCKPLRCHGDIIAEELQKKLIKENLEKRKRATK